jgi:hypothetical protein
MFEKKDCRGGFKAVSTIFFVYIFYLVVGASRSLVVGASRSLVVRASRSLVVASEQDARTNKHLYS